MTEIRDGFIPVNKPKGYSSFEVCNKIKKRFKVKKIGHSGTLDPQATGLLIVALNRATRAIRFLPSEKKIYNVTIEWGLETDSWDLEGKVIRREDCIPEGEKIEEVLPELIGEPMLPVPYFSAKKLHGKRMYKLAREGDYRNVEKPMSVHSIRSNGASSLEISCASGTYVRSIVHKLGLLLGCPATTAELSRIENNGFSLSDAVSLDELLNCDDIYGRITGLGDALESLKPLYLDKKSAEGLSFGSIPTRNMFGGPGIYRLMYSGKLLAVAEVGAGVKITNFT